VLLSHNTVRGAAGATVLNAEMLVSLGKLPPAPPDRSGSLQRKRKIEIGDAIAAGASALIGGGGSTGGMGVC